MPERKSPVVPTVIAAVAAIAVLGMVVAPALLAGTDDAGSGSTGTTTSESGRADRAPEQTWEQLVRREPDDPMATGDVDAPVVMVAYSEFQCPYCGKFARDTAPQLVEQYVEDGTLRIEWRDFPYLGPESTVAARAGRAAAQQDRFWDFHDAMYADQLPPNSGRLDEDYVAAVADDLGLDVDRFLDDLDSPAAEQAVASDFAEGQAIGVSGTPTFVINGIPVVGAQPVEAFEQAVEQAAAEAAR